MPAALQLVTMVFMFSLLSKAVLAVVVTQTPRIALGSQTGEGGGVGVGGVVPPPEFSPDLLHPMATNAKSTVRHKSFEKEGMAAKLICMKLR